MYAAAAAAAAATVAVKPRLRFRQWEKRERYKFIFKQHWWQSASTIVCVSLWSVRRPSRHSIFRSGRKSKINYASAYADLDPICELTRAALHYPVSGLRENYIHLQVMHRMSVSFWNCKSRTARDFIFYTLACKWLMYPTESSFSPKSFIYKMQ